jgi:hypothetical protein
MFQIPFADGLDLRKTTNFCFPNRGNCMNFLVLGLASVRSLPFDGSRTVSSFVAVLFVTVPPPRSGTVLASAPV